MQKMWAKEQEQYQRKTRLSDGLGEVQGSTKLDREVILEKWATAKMTTEVRKKKYTDIAKTELYGNQDQDMETESNTTSAETLDASVPSNITPQIQSEDTAFERDLQLAKLLSIVEQ